MTEETALAVQESVQLGTLQVAPEAIVARATSIANVLAKVIDDKKLFKQIGNSKHVYVDGWNTLGSMIGISPKENSVTYRLDEAVPHSVHEFEAYVDLIRNDDGVVVGGGSAICRSDEPNWKGKPLYAIRSMAITRATGKAFRLKLSWIIKLAGYSSTPAEEMDGIVNGDYREVPASTGKRQEGQWPEQEILDKIVDLQLVQAKPHAVNILNKSPFMDVPPGQLEMVEAVAYVAGWTMLKSELPDTSSDERAEVFNKAWVEDHATWTEKAIEMLGGE